MSYSEKIVGLLSSLRNEIDCELAGSWTVEVGDIDQALLLYRFKGGYAGVDRARKFLDENSVSFVCRKWPNNVSFTSDAISDSIVLQAYRSLIKEQASFLRERHLQFLLPFSFWPKIENRTGKNIYEIRTYTLKPGTMIEWGNNWAKAINYRTKNNEAFAGFFSQMGRLYNVHHIWCTYSILFVYYVIVG